VSFSRTVSISLNWRGISSSVSVTSSPSFARRDPPQQAQLFGDDALAFDVVRPGLAYRPLAREGAHALGFRRGGPRGKLIPARRGGEFFELQSQLFDQPRRALGALPVQFALEFLDPQLTMRDQRLVGRQLRLRPGS